MDFSLSEEQDELRALTARILSDLETPERLKEISASPERIDMRLWKEMASAGLLSAALPESCGGAGLGFVAAGVVAEECGRTAAAVPFESAIVGAAMPLAEFADDTQRRRWLDPLLTGEIFVMPALTEYGTDVTAPTTKAVEDGGGWRLEGSKTFVPGASVAEAFVVSAVGGDGEASLFLVSRDSSGISVNSQEATDGRLEGELQLDSVRVREDALLGNTGSAGTLPWLAEHLQAATCVEIAGACQAALKLTSEYTSRREQFGKPIATFQAVGQRAADAYIDTEAVRLTSWQAVWRLAEGLAASKEVAVAKFWADEGAQRVVHATQHLHGGMGVDRDYPLHRYYLLVKHLSLVLGGTTTSLVRLGDMLADEPV